ncbi:MAG: ACT domain-containing protein [Alphaproteobacteria bacterium]|jgi:glycine cleavage system regulatory protein|nr:ACT domain-containing protein [Alphaproteobacteria bacterium]MDP6872649.1 ACT domain-containing protein [Alphaproteobacteria bacterium]
MAKSPAKTLVLTFIAPDRPGLVEQLSEAVSSAGGNWLESRMARLAEKFAGITRVEIAGDRADALTDVLSALEADGFSLTIETAAAEILPEGPVFNLDLLGPDQPGIVRDISRCLSERGVSVEEMETDLRRAPMGGDMLFQARARVRLPNGLSAADLGQALEDLAGALMVDLTLRQEDTPAHN